MPWLERSPSSRDAQVLESLDEPIIVAELDGTILAWSVGAEKLYGWSRADALGKKVHELLKTITLANAGEIHGALLGPNARWAGELRKTRRDGSPINVRSQQQLLTDRDGHQVIVARDRDLAARSRTADASLRQTDDARFLELRERFQFSTDAAQIGYWFCDLPFDKLIWDSRVKEHFWLPPDADIDIDLFYSIIHPDDRDRTRLAIEESIAGHTRYDIEYRTVAPDGRQRWIRAIGRTQYDAVGTPIRFDGITQDITSLKRAEAELHESQRQLITFANSIPALAWMANADGWLFWYNRQWYEYTGTTPEQMEGWGWQSVHDPAILPSVMEQWNRSIQSGEQFEMIFPLRGADGAFRTFLTRSTPIRNDLGEVVRWFGTNTDIEELQRTRLDLQHSEARIRLALEAADILLYTTDRDLRYTWMYRAHPDFPMELMLGHRDIEVDPEFFRDVNALKQEVLQSGQPARREIRLSGKGRTGIYDYNIEPLHDDTGAIIGLTVAALDVTHARLAEDTLRRTEKLAIVGRLAASIAHEINNPLEAVVSLLYLARNMAVGEELRGYLLTAEEELYRVSHVVAHSLRFHRQSNGPAETYVSKLIESALALFRGRLQHASVQLVTSFRDPQPLLCLPGELRQVFANLIGNAFEATRAGRIALRSHPATNWRTGEPGIRVLVADTGIGIDARTLQSLFEPFITTKGEFGTGLGLWVSAEILKRHHAEIRVRTSTQPGRSGTLFSIFFPFNCPPPNQPAAPVDLNPLL